MRSEPLGSSIEHLLRDLAPQVLGAVARRHSDFAAAEDAVQEALIAAAIQWPEQGVPENARGWLYRVAVRRMTDQIRSEIARHRREDAVGSEIWAEWAFVPPPDVDIGANGDDTLMLLFMCCHPALTPSSAIALTLRAVGGLTTREIASAYLVPEATMAQRISRAKQTIKTSGVPLSMPSAGERSERLGSVLHVLYLIFNEGHTSSSGKGVTRPDLSNEAIRLARLLHDLRPDEPEITGLLALTLLTDARRGARTGDRGELIPLDEQDRKLWDRRMIEEGIALITDALPRGAVGTYQLQAAISAIHDEAGSAEDTDWQQILSLYSFLRRMSDNPMVALNEAIAVAMVHGAEAGLERLTEMDADGRLADNHRLDATRAHLLERAGDYRHAIDHYRSAAERTKSVEERNYLVLRAARLAADRESEEDRSPLTGRTTR